jgi:polyhydroxyalkanoate synthesis regulator phasin
VANWFAAPYTREVTERIAETKGDVERIDRKIDDVHARLEGALERVHTDLHDMVADLTAARAADAESSGREIDRVRRMLRHLGDGTEANRRRLYRLRESEEYELAFTDPDPLVSFVLPTYNRWEQLRDVALPSILGQTHANVEAIVVGDQAGPETAAAIAEIGDPRVRYYNRTVRGPYPEDPAVRWYMVGSPPYNDALSLVRGRWIAAMADDDAVRPDFAEVLLAAAREGRYENCYGRHRVLYSGGEELVLGSFPPKYAEFVTQAAIYHSGLRFFQMSLADPIYEEPNDWSLCRRMMDAGVRYGMIEAIVCDKHETRYEKHSEWSTRGIPEIE